MPTKEQYRRIVENKQICPKCGKHLDNSDYATCTMCRTGKESAETTELRRSAMATFGIGVKKSIPDESFQDRLRREVLPNVAYGGTVREIAKPILNGNISQILDLGSGSPRIQRTALKRISQIFSQPRELSTLNPFEIRCCLCHEVIRYPAWYYSIKYAVNHFHYFICFDNLSPDKPSTRCYRRE